MSKFGWLQIDLGLRKLISKIRKFSSLTSRSASHIHRYFQIIWDTVLEPMCSVIWLAYGLLFAVCIFVIPINRWGDTVHSHPRKRCTQSMTSCRNVRQRAAHWFPVLVLKNWAAFTSLEDDAAQMHIFYSEEHHQLEIIQNQSFCFLKTVPKHKSSAFHWG